MADYVFQILTPVGAVYDDAVQSVVAPGILGSFGVLLNHAPMIAETAVGDVVLIDKDGKTRSYAVGEGIFEVSHNSALLLVDSATEADASS